MNGCIIPENEEKCISPQQENAVFLVMGDEAYTDEMIDEYNRNAEAKTEEFNTNATNKTNAFNDNATAKTNAFNENATTQTDTYNSNATTKLSEYNSNATTSLQSYNENATSKTEAFNQNAAQKTYEFNQNALAYQEGIEENAEEIDEISNRVHRIENNLYDSGTAEGNFINIEDSSYSEFQNVNIDGASEQETTSGQNIYNFEDTMAVSDGVIVDEDGYITFTYDNSQGVSSAYLNYFTNPISLLKPNTNYSFFVEVKSISGNGYLSITSLDATSTIQQFVIPEKGNPIDFNSIRGNNIIKKDYMSKENLDDNSITVGVRTFVGMNSGDSGSITLRISILEDAAKTPETFIYEPYTGGQPSPSPDYPQPIGVIEEDFNITSCGKNLFDYNKFLGDIGDSLIIEGTNNNFTYTSNSSIPSVLGTFKFNFKEKISYSFSGKISSDSANGAMKVIYTDGTSFYVYSKWDGTSLSQEFFKTTDETKTIKQIEISSYGNGTVFELTDFMISEGSTATEYEPYQATTTQITLPDEQFAAKISDTTKDQFRIAYDESDGNYHLYLDKNIGKVVLNGSEEWMMNTNYTTSTMLAVQYLENGMLSNSRIISDNFTYNTISEINTIRATVQFLLIGLDITEFATVDDFKTWLQSHNTTVYYQLETPQTIELGKVQMPLTYYPITNVSTDCPLQPNIEVTYYRDFKTTIETMQKDIASNTSRIETLEEQLQSQATTISNLENRITALEPTQTESEVVEQ